MTIQLIVLMSIFIGSFIGALLALFYINIKAKRERDIRWNSLMDKSNKLNKDFQNKINKLKKDMKP